MKPTARQLSMRDPALAALLGVFATGNFGGEAREASFGSEFGDEFGDDFGGNDFGYDPNIHGDGFGADFGAAPAPTPAQAMALVRQAQAAQAVTQRRAQLLRPNAGSKINVERYAFAVNQTLTLGTTVALDMSGQPDTTIRPQRVTMNAPAPGFATITDIKVANVSVLVGGTDDAYNYNANGVGQTMDMPTLDPANRARVSGNYSGFVPPGYVVAGSYIFVCSFKGPSKVVG